MRFDVSVAAIIIKAFFLFYSIEKLIALLMNSTVNFTLSRSDEHDIGFSSEIYFGIHQFGNEFFLNRTSFKRKQAHSQRANGKGKKPFQSQLSIASEYESR